MNQVELVDAIVSVMNDCAREDRWLNLGPEGWYLGTIDGIVCIPCAWDAGEADVQASAAILARDCARIEMGG